VISTTYQFYTVFLLTDSTGGDKSPWNAW